MEKQVKLSFNNIFSLTSYIPDITLACNQDTIINKVFYISFFVLSLQNLECILHLEQVSVGTSHISGAQWPPVACGPQLGSTAITLDR